MTQLQKVIKYLAIAFGIYLSVSIIGMIVFGLTVIFGISTGIDIYEKNKEKISEITTNEYVYYQELENIDIDLSKCSLEIKKGEILKVEYDKNQTDLKCDFNGKELKISDNLVRTNWFDFSNIQSKVIIYLPETIKLKKTDIDLGAADTSIETLKCDNIKINTGAGRCCMQNIIAKDAKVDCGAGEIVIDGLEVGTLDLDGGVGKTSITGKIIKKADIDSGVGKLELNLKGTIEDYKIIAEKGIGRFTVDGKEITDSETIGTGTINIDIDSGVGETVVKFI